MHKYIILIVTLCLFSCTSQKKIQQQDAKETAILDSWLNKPKAALIQSWGPPTRYDSDGQEGEILIYESNRKIANVVYGTYMERTFTSYTEMYVNSNGTIYHWRTGRR